MSIPLWRARSPVWDSPAGAQGDSGDTVSGRSASTGRSTSAPRCCAPSPPRRQVDGHSPGHRLEPPESLGPEPAEGPPRGPDLQRHQDLVVVPRSHELEAAERDLRLALVALVAGNRPPVSPAMVTDYLSTFLGITDVSVHRHEPEDFIVRFARHEDRELVLRSAVPNAPFTLIWHPWRRTSLASAAAFHFRVLVAMSHVPLHARNTAVAQTILGTACAHIELAPPKVTPQDDEREFFVAGWCRHPSLVPEEKTIFIPEPNVRVPGNALYLDADEVALNRLPGLCYPVRLRIVEYQDWSTLPPSSDDEGRDFDNRDSYDSANNNFNRVHPGIDDYRSAPVRHRTYRLAGAGDNAPALGGRRGSTFMQRHTIRIGALLCPLVDDHSPAVAALEALPREGEDVATKEDRPTATAEATATVGLPLATRSAAGERDVILAAGSDGAQPTEIEVITSLVETLPHVVSATAAAHGATTPGNAGDDAATEVEGLASPVARDTRDSDGQGLCSAMAEGAPYGGVRTEVEVDISLVDRGACDMGSTGLIGSALDADPSLLGGAPANCDDNLYHVVMSSYVFDDDMHTVRRDYAPDRLLLDLCPNEVPRPATVVAPCTAGWA